MKLFRLKEIIREELDKMKNGFVTDIEKDTVDNTDYRRVLYTAKYSQLVLMSLEPGQDIGEDVHDDSDQFFRFDAGEGKIVINGKEHDIKDGSAVVVPAGCIHNVINTSDTEKLQLYAVYSPPHHKDGTVHSTKEDETEEDFDGQLSEGKEKLLYKVNYKDGTSDYVMMTGTERTKMPYGNVKNVGGENIAGKPKPLPKGEKLVSYEDMRKKAKKKVKESKITESITTEITLKGNPKQKIKQLLDFHKKSGRGIETPVWFFDFNNNRNKGALMGSDVSTLEIYGIKKNQSLYGKTAQDFIQNIEKVKLSKKPRAVGGSNYIRKGVKAYIKR